jgi:hypothetical protein
MTYGDRFKKYANLMKAHTTLLENVLVFFRHTNHTRHANKSTLAIQAVFPEKHNQK